MPRRRRAASRALAPAAQLRDTLRWGAFLGSFAGAFVAADEAIAFFGGRRRTRAWRAAASGALAGQALRLAGPDDHTSLALYLCVRGLTLLVRCGNLPGAAPAWRRAALAPTRWAHGDTALMCLASSQLLYSWVVLPSTLPPAYVRFLDKHCGAAPAVIAGVREMVAAADAGAPPGPLAALAGTRRAGFAGALPGPLVHPGRSAVAFALAFLPGAYLRALPVYLPVYLLPGLLVHRQRLLAPGAARLWGRMALGAARSSAFLALYCALAWQGALRGWAIAGRTTGAAVAAACWVAGLATLAEKKSRRMELAQYCAARAAESFALTLAARRALRAARAGGCKSAAAARGRGPRVDAALFSAAAAFVLHCYSDHGGARRDVFKGKYLAVFDFVLGGEGFAAAGVRHSASNADLLAAAAARLEGGGAALRRAARRSVASLAALGRAGGGGGGSEGEEEGGKGAKGAAGSKEL